MLNDKGRILGKWRSVAMAFVLTGCTIFIGTPDAALAHSFTVALQAAPMDQPARLTSAIRGMRLAAGERDSHADETSDGHLGGLDLFILVRPAEAAEGITWLKGAPNEPPAIVVDFSGSDPASFYIADKGAVVIGPGILPPDNLWSIDTPASADGFAARYRAAYGVAPDEQAAQGYNAARRIDQAVRAQGGVEDRESLRQSLERTANGIDW